MRWAEILQKLRLQKGFVEAVVFSGGEPTAHPGLADAMDEVRALGYRVGLHTAGIYPDALQGVLPHVDWVGMDIKAPFGPKYEAITGIEAAEHQAFESLLILLSSRKPFQLRTTMDPRFLTADDLLEINRMLGDWGVPPVVDQCVRCANELGYDFLS